jgi:hypothetical protein
MIDLFDLIKIPTYLWVMGSNMECNFDNQMHILRHFNNIPQEYYHKILNQPFQEWDTVTQQYKPNIATPHVIASILQTLGSKFKTLRICTLTPVYLFEIIKSQLESELSSLEGNITKQSNTDLFFTSYKKGKNEFLTTLFPDFIDGYASLMSKDQMNPSERLSVYRGKRGSSIDGYDVNIIDRKSLFPTRDLVVQIKKENIDKKPQLISCYNGIKTPSLPNIQFQNPKEYQISYKFWDNHAFINIVE